MSIQKTLRGLFVTGTDTGVGKTVVAACLTWALDGDYWKPVQSGLEGETDTEAVRRLLEFDEERMHPPAYELTRPLSPHQAAKLDGVSIDLDSFRLPKTPRPLVVEGAGGVLVPLSEDKTMVDLMVHLGLPVVLVARSGLGTINHTLLSLQALAARDISVLGVIVNGSSNPDNGEAIRHFGKVPVLMEMELMEPLGVGAIKGAAKKLSGILK